MKTQNNKLAFNKSAVTELNDSQLNNVNGGHPTIIMAFLASLAFSYAYGTNEGD